MPVVVLIGLFGMFRACEATPPGGSAWKMTFNDEFHGKTLNTDKWIAQDSGTGYYAAMRAANVELRNGVCRMVTKKEAYGGQEWTAARLDARTFTQKHGYFEVRMKVAAAAGMRSTLWLATDRDRPGMQHYFLDVARVWHPSTYDTRLGLMAGKSWDVAAEQFTAPDDVSRNFHVYGVEWNDKELIWYFDNREVRRLPHTACRYEAALHMITVVAGPKENLTDALHGATTELDYIRAYKKLARPPNWSQWQDGVQ